MEKITVVKIGCGGEPDTALALAADEKRRAHPLLQGADTHGQCGLGDIQRLCRRGHGAVLYHGPECLDVQIRHGNTPKIYQHLTIFYADNFNFTSRNFCSIVKITKDRPPPWGVRCTEICYFSTFLSFFSPKSQIIPRKRAGRDPCPFSMPAGRGRLHAEWRQSASCVCRGGTAKRPASCRSGADGV